MNMPASDNVRALFAELGVVSENSDESVALVIDRFDQWADHGRGALRVTGLCGCGQPFVAELEAA